MSKRKNPEPLLRDTEDLKKAKKFTINSTTNYMFSIKQEHSIFISEGLTNSFDVQHLLSNQVISIKIAPKPTFTKIIYDEKTLRKFLENFFKTSREDSDTEEKFKEKNDEEEKDKETTSEEKQSLREELLYQLLEKNFTAKTIAETFQIKVSDVYNIYYKKEKEIHQEENRLTPKRFLITQEMYDELEKFMEERKYIPKTLQMIKNHLVQKFSLENWRISLQTVLNMLRRLSFSRKRTKKLIERRNIFSTIKKRKKVANEFISALVSGKELIFLDETGFNQTLIPFYGYSKIGEKCLTKTSAKTENYSVVAAITKSKILGFQIFKGSVNATGFGAFVSSLLKNNPEILKKPSSYVFFMDNAKIHKAKILEPFFSNFYILYNAPYSPFLNPIEEFFGNLKHNFRKKINLNTVDILEKILRSFREIDNSILFSSYVHSMTFLEDCLDEKAIL